MIEVTETNLAISIDDAIRKLVSVQHFHAGSMVSMPVIYPSGASVVLEISAQAGRVRVCDRGGGYQEAEFSGATRSYGKFAVRAASDAGIQFDGRDIFVADVPIDRVVGAMTLVASCSAQAAAFCALKVAERHERFAREKMFDKLAAVFGPDGFSRDVPMIGASNHVWPVDAVIRVDKAFTVFNSVSKAYISAVGTAAKFHDLARLEYAPRRIAVVSSHQDLGDWSGVIASASDAIIEVDATNDRFYQMGMAA